MRSGLRRRAIQLPLMVIDPFDGTENLIGLRENAIFKQHDITLDFANIAFNASKPRFVTQQRLHHFVQSVFNSA